MTPEQAQLRSSMDQIMAESADLIHSMGGKTTEELNEEIASLRADRDTARASLAEARRVIEEIAAYDSGNGCCEYGCDTPHIAAAFLAKNQPNETKAKGESPCST